MTDTDDFNELMGAKSSQIMLSLRTERSQGRQKLKFLQKKIQQTYLTKHADLFFQIGQLIK